MDPRVGLDTMEKRQNPFPYQESNPESEGAEGKMRKGKEGVSEMFLWQMNENFPLLCEQQQEVQIPEGRFICVTRQNTVSYG
jgi:hypothetical protein